MPEGEGDPPLKDYYFGLSANEHGKLLFENVSKFFQLDNKQNDNKPLYFELLASLLYIYSATKQKHRMHDRLRILKSAETFDDDIIKESVNMFWDRKDCIINN
jgi:hypothetical protein